MKSTISKEDLKREEEELARAIQLSLKEANQKTQQQQKSTSSSSSLYGSLLSNTKSNSSTKLNGNDKRKVKAMYDFEAAEDNEITFKAGDILYIIDETDQNWWKGTDGKGNEGLFPSNFVTSDLSYEVESFGN
jgi:signal transducing adaptor molecule